MVAGPGNDEDEELQQLWEDSAKEMVEMSTRGRMTVLAGYEHLSILNAPELFAAVKEVVATARSGKP